MAYSMALVFMFAILVVAVGVVGLMLKLGSCVIRGLFGSPTPAVGRSTVCANSRCGYDNRPGARFCALCGERLERGNQLRR